MIVSTYQRKLPEQVDQQIEPHLLHLASVENRVTKDLICLGMNIQPLFVLCLLQMEQSLYLFLWLEFADVVRLVFE
jgi:hypothetical protein